jgi:hypothetical protein
MNTPSHVGKQLSLQSRLSGSLAATGTTLRRQLWVWPIIAALLLAGLGWWVHRSVESAMRQELAGQLTTILNADVEALRVWTKDQEAIARSLARMPVLEAPVKELLAIAERPDASPRTIIESRALADIRALFEPFLENYGYVEFMIVSPSMQIVGSKHDELIKVTQKGDARAFFQKVLTGPASVSRPTRAMLRLPNAKGELQPGLPTMFAASAIVDKKGQPIAVLALRIRPEAEFTQLLQTARFGYSGETYAFAENGLLLSLSRFDPEMKRIGLLADLPDSQSILTVEARDPQVNMMEGERPSLSRSDQPLTKLIAKAVSEGGGLEMEAYRDYRGVPSVGACQWLPERGFGIATEVDVADAFQPLYFLRRAIWGLLGLLVLSAGAILFFMIIVARQHRHMEKAERTIKELGQYTLEEKIGSGGMGSVYRARHALLRRPTAIKLMNPDNVTEGALARFEREVQLTSQLNHPNTIAIYDYGRTPEGVFYYAMEYLEGLSLEDLVKQLGPLPEGRVIDILQQVCGSLAEAHGIGLIHRDIKPANILLTRRAGVPDFVKVLDFGLVKVIDADEQAKLTQANVTVGTPYYMSPEAVERPDTITALSDIYAIGAVGYFLLTGGPAFTGKTVMDICMKHVRTTPDPPSKRLGRAVTPSVEALILRCLAKDPKDRPSSTRALMEELTKCEPAPGWTRIEAEAWWSAFKKPATSGAETAGTEVRQGTEGNGSVPAKSSLGEAR